MIVRPIHDTEKKLAGKLFGEENIKKELTDLKGPAPMMIFCKDNKLEGFMGDLIEGFSQKLCNTFHPVPTDMGLCIAKNLDITEVVNLNQDYSKIANAQSYANNRTFLDGGNRNEESTFVLLTDIYDTSVEKYEVNNTIFKSSKILNSDTFTIGCVSKVSR